MAVNKRMILGTLSKSALAEFARASGVTGCSTMDKGRLIDTLAGLRSLGLEAILTDMSRDELKAACEAAGLESSGREKAVLIDRLLGRDGAVGEVSDDAGISIKVDDAVLDADSGGASGDAASGKGGFVLSADPAPAPRLDFKKKKGGVSGTSWASASRGDGAAGAKRKIEQYEHAAAERLNNPPAGLVTPESDPLTPAPGSKARKQYQYDPHLDPQLVWAGKAERLSFDVDTVSLHVHERIDPKTILEAVKAKNGKPHEEQLGLFAKPRENPPLREAIDFYKHSHGWSNRLIAGDSLLVMNSLLEKEGMAGKVQMVYFDPPYGIKYGSNFQPFTNKRDVKDRSDGDLTREPEMLKAFRDTWELGIHSYLAYIRDRVMLARDLLAESGSIFVQIGEENVHLVRNVLDEVFRAENAMSIITFRKKEMSLGSKYLDSVSDYVIWYAKDKKSVKYRSLFRKKNVEGDSHWDRIQLPDGTRRKLTAEEISNHRTLPKGGLVYQLHAMTPARGINESGLFSVEVNGQVFSPPSGTSWSTSADGMKRLVDANRVEPYSTGGLRYVLFLDDYPVMPLTNLWDDLSSPAGAVYVVQTNPKAITRCLLMATDPGDLVLDPTCGSGTTAFVSEQWGRRWITCDTSRIAVTLAKQRLMQRDFEYYTLRYPEQGVVGGFQYASVQHITLGSIANNPEIKSGVSADAIDRAIKRYATPETLYDKPVPDKTRVRVTGPFTVEAVPAPVVMPISDLEQDADAVAKERPQADASITRDGETLRQSQWRSELLKTGARGEGKVMLGFTRVEPIAGARYLHALGEIRDRGGFRKATWKGGDSVAICFGPEHAPLEQRVVQMAWEEARELTPRPAVLLFAAFAFDPEAQKDIDEMDAAKAGMLFLRAGMNDDLATEDLKKKRSSNESFWLIGQPDIVLRRIASGKDAGRYEVEVQGFDYFDPKKGTIESGGTDRIAMWMLDPDYDGRSVFPRQVFFPMAGPKDGWARLGASLRAEIDQEKIEAYRGVKSLPFDGGKFKRVAVKIVDDRGIESLVIRGLDEAEGSASGRGAKK